MSRNGAVPAPDRHESEVASDSSPTGRGEAHELGVVEGVTVGRRTDRLDRVGNRECALDVGVPVREGAGMDASPRARSPWKGRLGERGQRGRLGKVALESEVTLESEGGVADRRNRVGDRERARKVGVREGALPDRHERSP